MSQRNGMSFCVNLIAILWLCSLSVSGMFAQSSPFHKDVKVPAAKISEAEASQVLVLGTVHLRSYGDDFNHDVLDRLLNVLEKYKPDLIGIESLAPIVIRDMVNSGEANAEILKDLIFPSVSSYSMSFKLFRNLLDLFLERAVQLLVTIVCILTGPLVGSDQVRVQVFELVKQHGLRIAARIGNELFLDRRKNFFAFALIFDRFFNFCRHTTRMTQRVLHFESKFRLGTYIGLCDPFFEDSRVHLNFERDTAAPIAHSQSRLIHPRRYHRT